MVLSVHNTGQIKYGMVVFSDRNAPDLPVNSSLQGGQIQKSFSMKASLDPVKHPKIARGQIRAIGRVWEQFNVMLHDESAGWARLVRQCAVVVQQPVVLDLWVSSSDAVTKEAKVPDVFC